MNYQHLGGRLFSYLNDSLLLSTGDMGHVNLSDSESSIFGKIINIKDNKNSFNIISRVIEILKVSITIKLEM